MIQLSKTGWLEEIIDVLKGVGVHVVTVMIGLYYSSGQLYERVGNGCDLILI